MENTTAVVPALRRVLLQLLVNEKSFSSFSSLRNRLRSFKLRSVITDPTWKKFFVASNVYLRFSSRILILSHS